MGYVGHISTRVDVSIKDFVFCLLPPMMALLCFDLLGGFHLWEQVDHTAYESPSYTQLFNLLSAMAGLHLLAYLAKAFILILQMRRDWASYQSQTLPESWYDMLKVLLVILIANVTQVISAFIHPSGESVSLGDIGFLILVWYFIYLAARTGLRNWLSTQATNPVIFETKDYLSSDHQPPLSDYSKCASHINAQVMASQPYLQDDLSLSSLAAQLEMTPHRLSEVLNNHFKKSFYEFVNDFRIEFAANQLISEPNKAITEIYYEAGFTTKSTFYSHFKKAYGCTPSEYRKQNQGAPTT